MRDAVKLLRSEIVEERNEARRRLWERSRDAVPTLLEAAASGEHWETATPPHLHPGEVLRDEFLEPLGLSQDQVAQDIGVPPRQIGDIVAGTGAVTAETALRLARYFSTAEDFWLRLQTEFELEQARQAAGERIKRDVEPRESSEAS